MVLKREGASSLKCMDRLISQMVSLWYLLNKLYVVYMITAKFHGAVLSTVQTSTSEEVKQSTLMFAETTVTTNSSSLAILDIAMYAILAIAGFFVLLFVTVLLGTILFYCGTKDKRRKY